MKFTLEELSKLKNICVKAKEFDLAVKFRDEERKIQKNLPKYKKRQLKKKERPPGKWVSADSFFKKWDEAIKKM